MKIVRITLSRKEKEQEHKDDEVEKFKHYLVSFLTILQRSFYFYSDPWYIFLAVVVTGIFHGLFWSFIIGKFIFGYEKVVIVKNVSQVIRW